MTDSTKSKQHQQQRPLYFLDRTNEKSEAEARATDDFLDSLLSVRSVTETKRVYSDWAVNYEKVGELLLFYCACAQTSKSFSLS